MDKEGPSYWITSQNTCRSYQNFPWSLQNNWKRNSNLHLSAPGSLWTVAIKVLECTFSLKIPFKTIAKGILKNDTKGLKLKGKSLTFDPACVSTKTKAGRFLTGMAFCQPFTKRQYVLKQFTLNYQTYIKLTICGNMYGVRKLDHFVPNFPKLEPRLVIFPYHDCATTKTECPFLNNCAMLSNATWCWI